MKLTLCAPCLFGLEGPLGNELRHMDMENVAPENGRVYFTGDESAVARANIRSRFAERILIVLGRFPARSFDELFEGVRALPWESFIPADGAFPVKGWALESALHSVPDCQKIVKKAVVERLKSVYGLSWFSEEGESFPVQFAIMKDEAALYIDTSGTGLHKRGYRPAQVAAPLRETLAAAIVDIARYRGRGDFCDPFCGTARSPLKPRSRRSTGRPASAGSSPPKRGAACRAASGRRSEIARAAANTAANITSSLPTLTPAPSLSRVRTPAAPEWRNTSTFPWPTRENSPAGRRTARSAPTRPTASVCSKRRRRSSSCAPSAKRCARPKTGKPM